MAKVISQETFDGVLKENIVEFSMSVEEARDETIKQFEGKYNLKTTLVVTKTFI
jgi:armadillo repeat-containing protein 6